MLFSVNAHSSCVILLHGLARTDSSMRKLENALAKEGYNVINTEYPSREYPIEILADKTIAIAIERCRPDEEINFVTHSLGGILVRQYLSNHEITMLNKVVMLGPPNKGSEVVDKLGNFPGFHFINGDAGQQLGTGASSIPNTLGSADFNVGIIAGTSSVNWILSALIPGIDDGKVSVERTKLDGMNDHLEMPVTHPFMMKNKKVIEQVVYYLKQGKFKRNNQFESHDRVE